MRGRKKLTQQQAGNQPHRLVAWLSIALPKKEKEKKKGESRGFAR